MFGYSKQDFGRQDPLQDWREAEGFYDPLEGEDKRFSFSLFKFFELMRSMVLFF